jgi:hypothetical protein
MPINVLRTRKGRPIKGNKGSAGIVARLDELVLSCEIAFSMIYCLSSDIVSSVEWYVHNGELRQTYMRETLQWGSGVRGRKDYGVK